MKTAYVTGAAGFAGCNLVEHLLEHDYFVYAFVRPGSSNNARLKGLDNVIMIEADMKDIAQCEVGSVFTRMPDTESCFFHLAWQGERYDFPTQTQNIQMTLDALELAAKLSCHRFIVTGSQAEYGTVRDIIQEDRMPMPFCDYGAAKVAACYLSRRRAQELGVSWIWGRIFSLYGKYEPKGRMLPDLIDKLIAGEDVSLSSCRQYWDYLNASDAAEALIALAKKGQSGEIYNIANGEYAALQEFVDIAASRFGGKSKLHFGNDPDPYVSLRPSVEKIKNHTGWRPKIDFRDGIEIYSWRKLHKG